MKPYEIEIFDRDFNFKYNALIDESDFSYSYDAISPVKNTLLITKDFKPSVLSSDRNAPSGWYVRIFRDDHEYQGIITGFDEAEKNNTIEISQLLTLFDNDILINSHITTTTSIETVIKNSFISNYINNSDSYQNIVGLQANNITVTSSTTGILDFFDLDSINDSVVIINFTNDLILKASSLYGIYVNCRFDAGNKKFYITVWKNTSPETVIESDLPNVIKKNISVRQSQNKVNKVTVYDKTTNTSKSMYLHNDGTYSDENTDRIYPVVNEVHSLDSYEEIKTEIISTVKNYSGVISKYADVDRDLTTAEYDELREAVHYVLPRIYQSITIPALINSVAPGVRTYTSDTAFEIGQQNVWFRPSEDDWGVYRLRASIFPRRLNIGTNEITYYTMQTAKGHIEVGGETDVYVDNEDESFYEQTVEVSAPLTGGVVNAAIAEYENSESYDPEVVQKTIVIIGARVEEVAKRVFISNKYKNLIEITVKADDTMINPMDLEIGQTVNIIHEGVSYTSILSGEEIKGGLVKLIFGTIRFELTKLLNMKGV